MQTKLLLTLLFITIIALIISSGCGGGSGITQPSLSLTPATSDKIAYIIINVKWPNGDIPGSFIISSADNKNELTASMTKDTHRIEIRIYEDKSTPGGDPIGTEPIGTATIKEPDTTAKIPVHIKNNSDDPAPNDPNTLGVLPVVPVKIWAGAFSDRDGYSLVNPISETLKDYTVVVGNNALNLQLGDYELTLKPDDPILDLPGQSRISSNAIADPNVYPTPGETPTPGTGGLVSTLITARLMIIYATPDPNASPAATVTPSSTPKPVANKTINFRVTGDGVTLMPLLGTTNSDGYCTTTLTTDTPGTKVIEASFRPDPNDPDPDNVYKVTCEVKVNSASNQYKLTLSADPQRLILNSGSNSKNKSMQGNAIAPDVTPTPGPSGSWSTITAKLTTISGVPVEGKEIDFSITGNDSLRPDNGTTDGNGNCTVKFIPSNAGIFTITGTLKDDSNVSASCNVTVDRDYAFELEGSAFGLIPDLQTMPEDNIPPQSKKTTITARLRKPDLSEPQQNLIPAAGEQINFSVIEGPAVLLQNSATTDQNGYASVEVDYSNYDLGENGHVETIIKAMFNNPVNPDNNSANCSVYFSTGHYYIDTFDEYAPHTYINALTPRWSGDDSSDSYIDSIGADNTGQSVKLHSNSAIATFLGDWYVGMEYRITRELRLYIMAKDKYSEGGLTFEGISGAYHGLPLRIRDVVKYDNQWNEISREKFLCDANLEKIAPFSTGTWHAVRVQILWSCGYSTPQKIKINYWMDGEFIKGIILQDVKISNQKCDLHISSYGSDMWFDQIEYYEGFHNWQP